eukprot:GEMP01115268.1.p1 GENE.GEMP01115268.1~~GEMP01115268.1.p1  ORF type:complete len:140 (+),score=10.84 GEMP01115268.1:36-422(+)
MSSSSMGVRFVKGSPPDKGSFPIDHENECRYKKIEYLRCLEEQSYDNLSCRYLAKDYLQCRMDHKLMHEEPMIRLGFRETDDKARKPRKVKRERKEDWGFIPGEAELLNRQHEWRIPNFLSFLRKYMS